MAAILVAFQVAGKSKGQKEKATDEPPTKELASFSF